MCVFKFIKHTLGVPGDFKGFQPKNKVDSYKKYISGPNQCGVFGTDADIDIR